MLDRKTYIQILVFETCPSYHKQSQTAPRRDGNLDFKLQDIDWKT